MKTLRMTYRAERESDSSCGWLSVCDCPAPDYVQVRPKATSGGLAAQRFF